MGAFEFKMKTRLTLISTDNLIELGNYISSRYDLNSIVFMKTDFISFLKVTKRYISYLCLINCTRIHFNHGSCFTSSSDRDITSFDSSLSVCSIDLICSCMLHDIIRIIQIITINEYNSSVISELKIW